MISRALLATALLVSPVLAQTVSLKAAEPQDPVRFSITTRLHLSESRKVLVDGEEGAFGGRGGRAGRTPGGPTETSLSQEIVFDQGPPGSDWRQYHKLTAKEVRPGRDGEPRESVVEGALQGKKVHLQQTEAGLQLREGEGEDAKPLPASLTRGVPARISLAGFLPAGPVQVGEEFDLSKGFLESLRGLVHPVTPDRSAGGQAGGGRGGQGRGGRGGRGGNRFGARMGPGSTVIQLLAAGKLDCEATGKVTRIDKQGDTEVAVLEITARLTGKGDAEALGLGAPARGGFGGGSQKVDATIRIEGTARADVHRGMIEKLELRGELQIDRDSKRTMGRDGQEREIQTLTASKGEFEIQAACQPAR